MKMDTAKNLQRLRKDAGAPEWMRDMGKYIQAGSPFDKTPLRDLMANCDKVPSCVHVEKKMGVYPDPQPCEKTQGGDTF
jgi:hypothetical protein